VVLAGCLVYAGWVGTQVVAYRLGSHRALGRALYSVPGTQLHEWRVAAVALTVSAIGVSILARGKRWTPALVAVCVLGSIAGFLVTLGPVYAPDRVLVWAFRYEGVNGLALVTRQGLWVSAGTFVAITGLVLVARPRRSATVPSRSHGSAAWSTGAELAGPRGLLLGRVTDSRSNPSPRSSKPTIIRYAGEGHLLTVAPTRSGKGVGCVIPNLLTYPGSVVVTDPKGENCAVTARQRRSLGQDVHVLDPFGLVDGHSTFNPLDLVDAESLDANDDARLLAEMLVVADGKSGGENTYWNEEARGLLTGLILHVAASAPPELRTLPHVRELLTLPPEPFTLVLRDMLESDAAGGLVARAGARHEQKSERERSGVVSAAQSHTHFLDSPRMGRVLGSSTTPVLELKREVLSLYFVLPPERMDAYARWLRIMIASSLLAVTRARGQPEHRVLFVLDEFAHLGRMQPVERNIGLAGGYGATFWLLVQDLAQLRGTYPDRWQTFLANCDVLQAFGTNDWDTADYLSKLTGDATIHVASENRSAGVSRGQHAQRQEGAALTLAERGRRLLTPDEALRLSREDELVFVKGSHPIRARRLDYRADEEFDGLAEANPMHADVRAAAPASGSHASCGAD
jgi:type IV secretion system protein VirD4